MKIAWVWCSPLLATWVACDNEAMNSSAACDASAITVDVAIDTTIGVGPTTTGYVVPLVVRASVPCLDGVTHAAVTTSEGQFGSAPNVGATTVVTLTPAGGDDYLGFATLQLPGGRSAARIQVTLGDTSACVTVMLSPDGGQDASVEMTDSGTCSP